MNGEKNIQYRGAQVSQEQYEAGVKAKSEERSAAHVQHVQYRGSEKDIHTDEPKKVVPHDILWRGNRTMLNF